MIVVADTKQYREFPKVIREMISRLAQVEGPVLAAPYVLVLSSDLTRPISKIGMKALYKEARKAARGVKEKIKKDGVDGESDKEELQKKSETEQAKSAEGLLLPSQQWVNAGGKKITAAVVKLDGDTVVFRMKGGKTVPYAMSKLSEESQKKIQEAATVAPE